ncbi:MAG TPA: prolyl oligopeptidase family serine peptidase [Blastocatellia bacterium]
MRSLMKLFVMFFLIVAMIAPLAQRGEATAYKVPDPLAVGPYPVGVTGTVFIDKSRTDNFTKEPRTLVTEIWYPATDDARQKPKNKYSDFIPAEARSQVDALMKLGFKISLADLDKNFWNDAVRDADVRNGRFPLVVFSHGNGGTRTQNTFWCDYLASHGYIVVSADHTANARVTIINGRVISYQASQRANSATDRPKDVSFLLDQMIAWDKGADKRFAGRIDTDRACAAGMSFGSYTAIVVADHDPRFKAVIAMAAAPESHTNLTVPSLLMLGEEDMTIRAAGNARIRDNHNAHKGPAYLLELKRGGHYSFTDMFKINKNFGDGVGRGKRRDTGEPIEYTPMEATYKIIDSYSIAFLGYYLKGQREYFDFLKSNHWPDVMNWDAKNNSQAAGK